jgi:hypothetical protein
MTSRIYQKTADSSLLQRGCLINGFREWKWATNLEKTYWRAQDVTLRWVNRCSLKIQAQNCNRLVIFFCWLSTHCMDYPHFYGYSSGFSSLLWIIKLSTLWHIVKQITHTFMDIQQVHNKHECKLRLVNSSWNQP